MTIPRGTQHINKTSKMKELGSCSNTYVMGLESYFSSGFNEAIEVLGTGNLTEGEINKAIKTKRERLEELGYEVSLGVGFKVKNESGLEKFSDISYYLKIREMSKLKRFFKE